VLVLIAFIVGMMAVAIARYRKRLD